MTVGTKTRTERLELWRISVAGGQVALANEELRQVSIEAIGPQGDVYK